MSAFLFGCARQERIDSPEFGSSWEETDYQGRKAAPRRRAISMTSAERKAFERTGQLDKKLDPWMEQEVTRVFLKYSRDRRSTMQAFMRNSTPYLANAKSVFRKHGLPEDLAYLAFLESGYNPLAVSRSHAVGMWQFISSTGRNYGLRQDWWVDERMDPQKSTEAAVSYLSRLYEIFHDWHLAIASYNAGEGKIGRAKDAAGAKKLEDIIRKNEGLSYDLRLREETRLYVPRFLAITKVVRGADELGLKPAPNDAKHPVLMPAIGLTAKPATDLVELCRRLGMTWREFLAYNPQFLRSISPANRSVTVYVPRNRESQARRLLAGNVSGAGWTYYTVRRKDTPARISRTTGVPTSIISQLNPGAMTAGRRLRLPSRAGSISPYIPAEPLRETQLAANFDDEDTVTAALAELEKDILQQRPRKPKADKTEITRPALPDTHKVRSGDTPARIASRYGISVASLNSANGGAAKLQNLKVGQVIRLKPLASGSSVQAAPATHIVAPGESLTGIARKHGISLQDLYAANGGAAKLKTISPGQ
ncbi:MAG: transglycosylase SLT domain-containing protein, partial [Mailhella sp.]|nr:transglycosylase SLT domain-containing protein [Mailhella sp.]